MPLLIGAAADEATDSLAGGFIEVSEATGADPDVFIFICEIQHGALPSEYLDEKKD